MKPILFNTEMVRAILGGRKTVTRRVIKNQDIINAWDMEADGTPVAFIDNATGDSYSPTLPCRYQPGDVLYVRETWQHIPCIDCLEAAMGQCNFKPVTYEDKYSISDGCFIYRTDYTEPERIVWRPSIHMPREAARIFLWVTDVRVERLKDMTDAYDEGFTDWNDVVRVWDATIKPADRDKYGWAANPWVWVIEFERISREEAERYGA